MKLAQFEWKGKTRAGIVEGNYVHDVGESSLDQILSKGLLDSLKKRQNALVKSTAGTPLSSVRLLSPVLFPEKIFCVAENYRSHVREADGKVAKKPYLFTKFRNAIVGPNEAILIPKISKKVDWEAELAVVIGSSGKHIPKERAISHVAGYCVSNDVSFRDIQFPEGWPKELNRLGQNWVLGKSLDGSFPLGPWLVTTDEIPDPHKLGISLSVNGELKQSSNTGEMVFSVASLIEYISAGITLRAGDVISTGTPQGVAAFTDQRFLKEGDLVEARIDRIGTLRNPVESEK
ncbi:MAG: fumarylacetoacetate hydrolase family protein [Nitrososphaerales archaeon]|jgi:2-keto-4-pentenoate hydratase/2-oxohepta-3-ene-1,7-dioic acid hydratase in catechol pathway